MVHDLIAITHRNILHHPRRGCIVFFLIYCMFHILTVCISRVRVLAASNHQQIFDSPPTRRLEETIKAFGGKQAETMAVRTLLTASRRRGKAGSSSVSYPRHREPEQRTEFMKARETLRTNSLLSVQGEGVWRQSRTKDSCVFTEACLLNKSSQPLSAVPEGAGVAALATSLEEVPVCSDF